MRVFLIDADNLSSPAWVDEAFQALETAEGSIAVRRAYGSAENLKGLADTLRTWAIRTFVNLSLSKNTTDIALAADAMEFACQQPAPAMIVIGSGEADFLPLVGGPCRVGPAVAPSARPGGGAREGPPLGACGCAGHQGRCEKGAGQKGGRPQGSARGPTRSEGG